MTHFDESDNFALELFCQIVLTKVLSIVLKLKLLDGYIVLLISSLENISTGTSSNLLFKTNIVDIYSEVILAHLKLLCKNGARLLSLRHLAGIK